MRHEDLIALIRAGKFDQVASHLRELEIKKIPRDRALQYANIARRIGHYKTALRILNPIVRSKRVLNEPATPEELVEYAESLRRSGAVTEALKILNSPQAKKIPLADFHLALCLFSRWEYGPAIPLLESYVKSLNESSYDALVGKVNLAAAFIYENHLSKARRVVKDVLSETDTPELSLIHGHCMMLAAQLEVASEDWKRALALLQQASQQLQKAQGSVDALLVMKWQAVVGALQSNTVTPVLLKIRDQSQKARHWETVRDCDFYIAKINHDVRLLYRLYFGTPYNSFRQRILKELPAGIEIPASFTWCGEYAQKPKMVFELSTAESSDLELAPGKALHKLLILLSSDFYRPVPLVSLFSYLFPEEYYNPDTSPNRVHLIVKRLRRWLTKNKVGLRIEEHYGVYQLVFDGSFGIQVPREPLPLGHRELQLLKAQSSLFEKDFSTKEFAKKLGGSPALAQRVLKWAVSSGRAMSVGKGPQTRYRFTTSN